MKQRYNKQLSIAYGNLILIIWSGVSISISGIAEAGNVLLDKFWSNKS